MENKKLNNLIEVSLNPYFILKLELQHTEEECNIIKQSLENGENLKFINELEKNSINIEEKYNLDYLFIKQDFIPKLNNFLIKLNIKFTLKDASDEIFNMKDISRFNIEDPCPELTKLAFGDELISKGNPMEIIKLVINNKYELDNVLDKISKDGIESLNELHKNILNCN